jgi:beta-galactosidase
MRRVLDRHGLRGPFPPVAGLEVAERVAPDGRRLTFLLNHGPEAAEVVARAGAVDLLTGARITRGATIRLAPRDVMILSQ